jgi:hypothetical protein
MRCIRVAFRSYSRVMARWLLMASLLLTAASARAGELDDARLGASAGEVHAIVDGAAQAGVPPQLLVDKVREGLAKGVPPARIATVVRGLSVALQQARSEAQPFAPSPPPGLLKAIVEAHAAGVAASDVHAVLAANGRERAIQVLTDLVQRGYPSADSSRTVATIAGREKALDQLVGQAERLRTIDGATPADALDALTRANAQGLPLNRADALLRRDGNDRGPNRETSGVRGPKSGGVAAPGRSKP